MRFVDPIASVARALALSAVVLFGACSSDGSYRVVVRFDPPALVDRASSVELAIVDACDADALLGGVIAGARERLTVGRGESPTALGAIAPGTYGLAGRALDGSCTVVAAGCSPVHIEAGGSGELVVTLRAVSGALACAAGVACESGLCGGRDPARDASSPMDARSEAAPPDATPSADHVAPPIDGAMDTSVPPPDGAIADATPPPLDGSTDTSVPPPDDAGSSDTGAADAPPSDGGPPTDAGGPLPDLVVDPDALDETAHVVWQYFEPDACEVSEVCVLAPGWRRLLRFTTVVSNAGSGDLELGPPSESGYHVRDECHDHWHLLTPIEHRLVDGVGTVIASGRSPSFCFEDDEGPGRPRFGCSDQGLQHGWSAVMRYEEDCQWIDVTGVAAGTYALRVSLAEHFTQTDVTNDEASIEITIPPEDVSPTGPCDPRGLEGEMRECGWAPSPATFACTPGNDLDVGCGGATCGMTDCTGDPMIRICDGAAPCNGRDSLESNDDCRDETLCSASRITCPASGTVSVLTAPYTDGDSATCSVVAIAR